VCESKIARLKTLKVDTIKYIDISSVDRATKSVSGVTEYAVKDAPGRAQQVVYPDDLLVSTVRPNLNTVALVPDDIIGTPIASTGFSVLRANGLTCPRWLYYYSQTSEFIDPLVADSEKAAYPSVTDSRVREVEIPIPPLPEQRRIVAKIDAAFAKIDRLKANAEKNRTNAKELFQSALDEAMRPKPGWVEKRLGEVAEIRVGPFGSSLHKADYVAKGVPLVNPCHMRNSQIQEHIETQITEGKANELSAYRLREGDIVFARRGEIGRLAFVSSREDGYLCGTGSLFARFREKIDPEFLYFVFSGRSFVERLEKLSTGATMKSINSAALSGMTFFMPRDAGEMKKSVELLDGLRAQGNRMESNYTRLNADCAEMRQAVLKEAFEGKL